MNMTEATAPERADIQRRTLGTLMAGQALGGAAVSSAFAVVGLLASDISGNDRMAGVAAAMLTVGAAVASVPLSRLMRRRGRRPGLRLGYVIGSAGAVIAVVAGQARSLPLLLAAMFLFGWAQSSNLQGRYVAADLAEPDHRARAISTVVWVGTLGAVFGPTLAPVEKAIGEGIGLDRLVAPILFSAAFFVLAGLNIAVRLRPDPLVVAGGLQPDGVAQTKVLVQLRRSLAVIAARPMARLALLAMVISQVSMVAVMTMTPLHMKDHGQADLSAFVIAFHIVGMYGSAPLVGRFADRTGRIPAIMVGSGILAVGTVVAVLAGYHPSLIFAGLFLLGLGWNFGLIGGSALLTESVPTDERVGVQGSADLLMSMCGGAAGFSSGFIKAAWGYHMLANAATVAAGVLMAAALVARKVLASRPATAGVA
jgi:MFS family permease